jgi:putative transposase
MDRPAAQVFERHDCGFGRRSAVSATARDGVKLYIANQAENHRVRPFREELIEMLRRAEIKFEDRFLD